MIILATEQSSSTCSIALLKDTAVLAEACWINAGAENHRLFLQLPGLLKQASIETIDIDMFSTGLGPGSFSGLRSALSAIRAMALPGHKPVIGINSTEALARQIFQNTGCRKLLIIGDARRNRLWLSSFESPPPVPETVISMTTIAELPGILKNKNEFLIATPDWDRIGPQLKQCLNSSQTLIEEKVAPKASDVAILAFEKLQLDSQLLPLSPIYLHPPVSIEPKFRSPVKDPNPDNA